MKAFVLFALCLLTLAPLCAVLDRIVAVVDEEIILESELVELAKMTFQSMGRAVPEGADFDAVKAKLLESMIEDKLLLKQAEAESVKVSREEIMDIRDRKIEGFIAQVGSAEALEKVLRETYGLSLAKFKKDLEKQIGDEMLKMRLLEGLKMKYAPTRKEVERFYLEYRDSLPMEKSSVRLSHIMRKIEPAPELVAEAEKKIRSIEEKLQAGGSFEKLAGEYSDDPASAKNGGDLGFFSKGFLDKNFEKTAFSLNVGEISGVTRSRYGFHIIKLEERKGEKEIRVRHILTLIRPGPGDTLKAGAFLDSLKALCASDSAFAALAGLVSEDKLTQKKGGDLGWLSVDGLSPGYRSAIKDLDTGGNSEPVLIDDAFHLFRVTGKKEERPLDLENDFDTIKEFAANWKIKQEAKNLCDRLRQKVYIENRLNPAREQGHD